MKPFGYAAPTSVGKAVELLAKHDDRARPFAGGTDLLVQLRLGRRELDLLVDVKRIPDLNEIAYDAGKGLTLGAGVSCAALCEHPDVLAHYPGLVDAAGTIGGSAIQGRATVGGNLCNAAPSADSIPALIVLDATVEIAGPKGRRTMPVRGFCTGPGETVLAPGELVVSLLLPAPQPDTGACYLRFIPRGEMDIAVAGAGAWVKLNEDGSRIIDARVALSAVAPVPLHVEEAGASLVGKVPTEEAYAEAAVLAQKAARPIDDVRGTAAQRRHLVGVLTKRALRTAVARAMAQTGEGEA